MSHILLAMSGGVDSSVAAAVLLEQGHRVSGIYMRHSLQIRPEEEHDAREAARRLGIPLHILDIDEPFQEIVEKFCSDYLAAKTPNPCAWCNRKIKFGLLPKFGDTISADFFATGHYARVERQADDSFALCRGVDRNKDQSYLLYGINRELLPRLIFPLGKMLKSQVREKAQQMNLPVSQKKDSQEICFVEPHRHVEWIRARNPGMNTSGNFVSTDGKILGHHDGFEQFTIGQRKGMKVGFGKRIFVVKIDVVTKNVVLGDREDLAVGEITIIETNWLADLPHGEPFASDVKIRYRNEPGAAEVTIFRKESHPGESYAKIKFHEPKYGVAPGQIAVCFSGDRVLGGGTIACPKVMFQPFGTK